MKTQATEKTSKKILYPAAGLSLAAGLIHLWAAPEHLKEWWAYGAFFLLVALAQGLFGLGLLRWPGKPLYLAGIAANLSIVSLYTVTRTVGVPFIGPHAWHAEEFGKLDLAATAAEVLLIVALAALARGLSAGKTSLRPRTFWRPRAATALVGALTALTLLVGPNLSYLGQNLFSLEKAEAATTDAPCNATTAVDRTYNVAAISVKIPYNRYVQLGDVDPATGERVASNINEHGTAFVLQDDKAAVKNWYVPLGKNPDGTLNPDNDPAGAQNRRLRPRPLVIRANEGECVAVKLTNDLTPADLDPSLPKDPRVSMRVNGIAYDAKSSDGSMVGFNPDSTVGIGEPAKTYYWKAPSGQGAEGMYFFRDEGTTAFSEANAGSLANGLYGAFAVEPVGSKWLDPETGKPMYRNEGTATNPVYNRIDKESGDPYVQADIVPQSSYAFRESIMISQDEIPNSIGMGFNYGSEPQHNREAPDRIVPDGIGEEVSLSSWAYGDPALVKLASGIPTPADGGWLPQKTTDESGTTVWKSSEDCGLETQTVGSLASPDAKGSCYVSNVVHTYRGDPTKIRFLHAGPKETHVFHLHAHQWLAEPDDGIHTPATRDAALDKGNIIDSQTFGPGEAFTADLIDGSGSTEGTLGDSIFHCHLYSHFAEGFWALLRTHDVLESGHAVAGVPGSGQTPDGINVRNLEPLPNNQNVPAASADNPGYPRFIPGKPGWRAPQPAGGISEQIPGKTDTLGTIAREDLAPATRIVAGQDVGTGNDSLDKLQAELDTATDPARISVLKQLIAERKVHNLGYTGSATNDVPVKGGAPYSDPCPTGSREVTYNASIIQTDVTYNKAGWHDKQARIVVANKDVKDVLSDKKQAQPYFFRVNAGDCINFNLTNRVPNWFGGDAFVAFEQTNMFGGHIHLVKFDVTSSDGSSNGWNYQGATYSQEQAEFDKQVLNGTQACNPTPAGCRVGGAYTTSAEAQQVANAAGSLAADGTPKNTALNADGTITPTGQTITERWYADRELRTVFTHDHHFAAADQNRGEFGALIVEPAKADFRNPYTGEYYQPINQAAHATAGNPVCTTACEGTASPVWKAPNAANGFQEAIPGMDVIGPGTNDDFREYGLALGDFTSLHDATNNPLNAPSAPEHYPAADPGVMGINYRNEPFKIRNDSKPNADPAHIFSSYVHGDPATPILNAYTNDPMRIRLIQGSQEENHSFSVQGIRWRREPNNPNSPLINTQPLGISEAFNFHAPAVDCAATQAQQLCMTDLLYGGNATDDLWDGAWGIMRVRGERASLLPLPDYPVRDVFNGDVVPGRPAAGATPPALPAGSQGGAPCPTGPGTPIRNYNVVAMQADIPYNKEEHDPFGLIYALMQGKETPAQAVARIKAEGNYKPLVIRANEGECINVTLYNQLTNSWLTQHGNAGTNGDPTLALEPATGTKAGLRVSLSPQLVKYDPRFSNGATVGFGYDQTVAPGGSIQYRWYADDVNPGEIGATNLLDFGDVRGHRHHGLFAGLIIEPKGSTYTDPISGAQITSGTSANINVPDAAGQVGTNNFREFTPFIQDGLNLWSNATGKPIDDPFDHPPVPGEPAAAIDIEDQGEKGFNYRSEPYRLQNRLGFEPASVTGLGTDISTYGDKLAHVFSSTLNGDPATPIFRTNAGDPIRVRVLQGSDKPRMHSFQLSGSNWHNQPYNPISRLIGTYSGMSVNRAENIHLNDATGGQGLMYSGDYRYGSGNLFNDLAGGMWGIVRVYNPPAAGAAKSPLNTTGNDNPTTQGYNPIVPLGK